MQLYRRLTNLRKVLESDDILTEIRPRENYKKWQLEVIRSTERGEYTEKVKDKQKYEMKIDEVENTICINKDETGGGMTHHRYHKPVRQS